MKNILIALIVFLTVENAFAQQDPQYANYMYNTVSVNPAYAGSRDAFSVFALHRNQWVGLDGAPVTSNFCIDSPIQNTNLGVGFSVINDKIGPSDENSVSADVSYYIHTSETFKLSFGLKASINLLNVDFSKLNIYDSGDPMLHQNIDNRVSPNFGAGAYFYSDKTYIGLSVTNFLETKYFDKSAVDLASATVATGRLHSYLIAGHVFDLSPSLKFKPTILSKIVTGAPLQTDLSANFMFNEKFTVGVSHRWGAAMSAMAGFQVSDSWFVGYSYDADVTNLSNYNSGSHEFFLRYELFKKDYGIASPRFF